MEEELEEGASLAPEALPLPVLRPNQQLHLCQTTLEVPNLIQSLDCRSRSSLSCSRASRTASLVIWAINAGSMAMAAGCGASTRALKAFPLVGAGEVGGVFPRERLLIRSCGVCRRETLRPRRSCSSSDVAASSEMPSAEAAAAWRRVCTRSSGSSAVEDGRHQLDMGKEGVCLRCHQVFRQIDSNIGMEMSHVSLT